MAAARRLLLLSVPALLLAAAATTGSTASNSLDLESNTANYRQLSLQSSYDVRIRNVSYGVVAGQITSVTLTLAGDVRTGLLLNVSARPVAIRFGSGAWLGCVESLLTLDSQIQAVCSPVVEDAVRPRELTVSVG